MARKAGGGRSRGPGRSAPHARVKTAKKRSNSSARWLQRQLNDPYVARARAEGLRSRAAYKLIEMDDRFRLFRRGARVIDLGAAPGGWSQVAAERVGAERGGGQVIAVDTQEMDPIPGVEAVQLDFMAEGADRRLLDMAGGPVDVVLSDMAPASTGIASVDHLRIMGLCETAFDFARHVLAPGGAFVAKVLRGGGEATLVAELKRAFRSVRHVKPPASRSDSAELYVVALGFRGDGEAEEETVKNGPRA